MATTETEAPQEGVKTQLTEKEIAERREKITKYYESQIPHLETQLKYEELMTKIEETRAKRLQAQAFMAQAYGPGEEEEEEIKRTLKRD
mgnify:CR=1 FL=1|jgi:hypothetical protein